MTKTLAFLSRVPSDYMVIEAPEGVPNVWPTAMVVDADYAKKLSQRSASCYHDVRWSWLNSGTRASKGRQWRQERTDSLHMKRYEYYECEEGSV